MLAASLEPPPQPYQPIATQKAAFGSLRLSKAPPGVIEAEDKFAKRRLEHLSQWKPTKADVGKLREPSRCAT